jgi:pilus assembly protein CpaB
MRAKSLALLVLALGCGLVASLGITQVMAKRNGGPVVVAGDTAPVYVAAKDIALQEALTADMLTLKQWSKDTVPAGALGNLEDVEGRVTKTRIYAGEPILENKLFGKGVNGQSIGGLIPKGYRVVAVKVDRVSGGELLQPGARVDVMLHLLRDPNRGIMETTTRIILQDIKVFAVNAVTNMESTSQDSKSIAASTVSLLVTPAQALKVTMASELGNLRLAMRSPEEDSHADTKPAEVRDIYNAPDGSTPAKEALVGRSAEATKGQGFSDFLAKSMAERSAAVGDAQAAKERWSIRLLNGAEVKDFDLEGDRLASADDDAAWRIVNPSPPPAPKAEKPAIDVKKPASPTDGAKPGSAGPQKDNKSKEDKPAS